MPERVTRIIGEMMDAAVQSTKGGTTALEELSAKVLTELEEFYLDDAVSFTVLGNILLFNEFIRITENEAFVEDFIHRLREGGVKKFTVSRGATPAEFGAFIRKLAAGGKVLASTTGISLDLVRVTAPNEGVMEVPAVVVRAVEHLKQQFNELGEAGHLLDIASCEETAGSLAGLLKREPNVMKMLLLPRNPDEERAVHGINVGLLAAFQAASLGFEGQMLQEITLAGMLHDIGALFLAESSPQDGEAGQETWQESKNHPVRGAMFLAKHRDPPRTAVIVVFEHHMKYNGTGYPDTKRRGKIQNLATQIVAIADFCAVLLKGTERRRVLGIREIAGLLRELAGQDFNPVLVRSFIRRLKVVNAL